MGLTRVGLEKAPSEAPENTCGDHCGGETVCEPGSLCSFGSPLNA